MTEFGAGKRRAVVSWRKGGGILWLLLLTLAVSVAGAQEAAGRGLREASRAEYGAELRRLVPVVEKCRAAAAACDAKAVPGDEAVAAGDGQPGFQVRWDWLRAALRKGAGEDENAGKKFEDKEDEKSPEEKRKDRDETLAGAAVRLREDAATLAGGVAPTEDAGGARRKLDEVLARREFGQVQQMSWWQTVLAKVYGWVDDWMERMRGVVPWAPWMGLAVQWGLLGAAAAGLIVWAMRLGKQQRVGFVAHRESAAAWQVESEDWAAKAKAEAAKGEWREAVHCLYWSAIVMLEGQRLWRPNRARTPREYVALLEAGSARRRVLGGLTGVFERIWYGIRPATGEDYARAAALLEELRAG